jgi:hypothetical protein
MISRLGDTELDANLEGNLGWKDPRDHDRKAAEDGSIESTWLARWAREKPRR